MQIQPEISGASIVLLGNFNPAIFSPAWFDLHDILPENVAETADVQIISPSFTSFSTEWLYLQVTADRFQLQTEQDPYIRLRDLISRVFKEHVFHTPLVAFGINRYVHFRAPSQQAWDQLGRTLAPVEPWADCEKLLALGEEGNGLASLTMRQSQPQGRPSGGYIDVRVEPSNRIGQGKDGVYVHVNDHYEIDETSKNGRTQLLDTLEKCFESDIKNSDEVVDHIMGLTKAKA